MRSDSPSFFSAGEVQRIKEWVAALSEKKDAWRDSHAATSLSAAAYSVGPSRPDDKIDPLIQTKRVVSDCLVLVR